MSLRKKSLKLSFRLLRFLMTLLLADRVMATPIRKCDRLFLNSQRQEGAPSQTQWPPQVWSTYLKERIQINKKNSKHTTQMTKMKLIPPKKIAEKIEDYRFHLVPDFLNKKYEVSKKYINLSLLDLKTEHSSYEYSYQAEYVTDEFAVFKTHEGFKFNVNLALYPVNSQKFKKELSRIEKIVVDKQSNPSLNSFFQEAKFEHGGWHKNQVTGNFQNKEWPGSSGFRMGVFPIGKPLGSKHDYLMHSNLFVFYPQDHVCLQTIRKYRESGVHRQETLFNAWNYYSKNDPSVIKDATEDKYEDVILSAGRKQMEDTIVEIHSAIFPDYIKRRGWPQKFLDSLFDDALEMDSHLEFTLVRELLPQNQVGKIIGIIGFNTSSYGKVEHFDPNMNSWQQMIGKTGSAYSRFNPEQMPYGRPSYLKEYWSSPIPPLPVENYIEKSGELNRPSVVERIERPYSVTQDTSPVHPTIFSVGENLEVVRLWVNQEAPQSSHVFVKLLYSWLYRIYESGNTFDYVWKGQRQITYNPRSEGRLLYGPYGYKIDETLSLRQDTLDKLTAFFSDPELFLKAISNPDFLSRRVTEEEAKQFLSYLSEYVQKKPAPQ
jgi:hypothetical protein